MNHRKYLAGAIAGVFAIAAGLARAATYTSETLGAITPQSGTYIDYAGNVSSEFDSNGGGGFLMLHTYDAGGAQVNYISQPGVVPTSEADRLATGVIARASGEFYFATGGSCLGCAPVAPVLTFTGIHYVAEWSSARHYTLSLSGGLSNVFHLDAVGFTSADDDAFLPGTWAATVMVDFSAAYTGDPSHAYQSAAMAIVKVTALPATAALALDPAAPASVVLPPPTARLYRISCPDDSAGQGIAVDQPCLLFDSYIGVPDSVPGAAGIFWFDPPSKRSGYISATESAGTYIVDAYNLRFDLSLTQDLISGHGAIENNGDTFNLLSLRMVRIPDRTVRDQLDGKQLQ